MTFGKILVHEHKKLRENFQTLENLKSSLTAITT